MPQPSLPDLLPSSDPEGGRGWTPPGPRADCRAGSGAWPGGLGRRGDQRRARWSKDGGDGGARGQTCQWGPSVSTEEARSRPAAGWRGGGVAEPRSWKGWGRPALRVHLHFSLSEFEQMQHLGHRITPSSTFYLPRPPAMSHWKVPWISCGIQV